jgi:hypothetical protein
LRSLMLSDRSSSSKEAVNFPALAQMRLLWRRMVASSEFESDRWPESIERA